MPTHPNTTFPKKPGWLSFGAGAVLYPLLEIAYRGHSHGSMAMAGGLCCYLLRQIEHRHADARLWQKCCLGSLAISSVEYLTGCLVNRMMRLKVWDYSHLPLNLRGQICLPYCLLWFGLCLPVFVCLHSRIAAADFDLP